jgi:hypothetical protein
MTWYVMLVGLVVVERMAEVVVANRNRTGAGHGEASSLAPGTTQSW